MPDGVRQWTVASAVVETSDGLLLVLNRRRSGATDWSTPGGVVDGADHSIVAGLAREVEEETGLRVRSWEGPLYAVEAVAVEAGWAMRCEVHRAVAFDGELRVADPDGIVIDAEFVPLAEAARRLEPSLRWVREPLTEWMLDRWAPGAPRDYRYDVRGTTLDDFEVLRTGRG